MSSKWTGLPVFNNTARTRWVCADDLLAGFSERLRTSPQRDIKSTLPYLGAMSREEWSDFENDAIVADYFSMLLDELAGAKYNKAAHNRTLQEVTGRSKGSIEFKHQNISAVLKGLGETWINGYKPAFNFQMSLVDAVARQLHRQGGWFPRAVTSSSGASEAPGALWLGTPPTMKNTPPPDELEQIQVVAHKFDVAGRDERNRVLGKAGEERVLNHERAILVSA